MDTMLAALPGQYAQDRGDDAASTELISRASSEQRVIGPASIANWGYVREARVLPAADFPANDAAQASELCSVRELAGMQQPVLSEQRDEGLRWDVSCIGEEHAQCGHATLHQTNLCHSTVSEQPVPWQGSSTRVADALASEVAAQEPTPPVGSTTPEGSVLQDMSNHAHSIKALKSLTRMVMYASNLIKLPVATNGAQLGTPGRTPLRSAGAQAMQL